MKRAFMHWSIVEFRRTFAAKKKTRATKKLVVLSRDYSTRRISSFLPTKLFHIAVRDLNGIPYIKAHYAGAINMGDVYI